MNDCVLFSPIGNTDPTKNNFDGPLLHIVRYYQPKKVYLFFTKEMCDYDLQDNRYESMVKKLLPSTQVIKIKHEEINNPQNFSVFDEPYKNAMIKVKEENPLSEILVNISSGTPQMIASLYLLTAGLNFHVELIQVTTPGEKGNHGQKEYNCENEWDNLEDNSQELVGDKKPKNRTVKVLFDSIRKKILMENVESHIKKYDYSAAQQLLKGSGDLFCNEFKYLIKMANARISLDLETALKELKNAKVKPSNIFPFNGAEKNRNQCGIFEYILYLKIKVAKNELADFTRGVSPVIVDLFELVLEKICKINIYQRKWAALKGVPKLIPANMEPELLAYLNDKCKAEFRETPIASSNLLWIIEYYRDKCTPEIIEKLQMLREFDEKARNLAAHEIVNIKEVLQKNQNLQPEKILSYIRSIYEEIYPCKNGVWNSYDDMNDKILSYKWKA